MTPNRSSVPVLAVAAVVWLAMATGCASVGGDSGLASHDVSVKPAAGCEALPDPERAAIIIFDAQARQALVCNHARARQRFVPASTYKIPHSLIALESGVVTDEDRAFGWDGRDRGVPSWNGDKSLVDAVPASAVWVFQSIAKSIGHAGEAQWVRRLDYGNADVGSPADLTTFWLKGPLRISAEEQIDFLQRLDEGRLDASASAIEKTRRLIRLHQSADGCVFYGKTGAVLPIDHEGFLRMDSTDLLPAGIERTGWFVGWIERPEHIGGPVFFAMNLDLGLPGAMAARTKATYAVLAANGFPVPGEG